MTVAVGGTSSVTKDALTERFADIVSVHLALSRETRGLLGEAFFQRMKPGAMFLNTSRGEVVDHQALERAVRDHGVVGREGDERPEELSPAAEIVGGEHRGRIERHRLPFAPGEGFRHPRLPDDAAERLGTEEAGRFAEAEKAFANVVRLDPADTTAAMMRERCRFLRLRPPADWTGVWKLDSK